MSSHITSHLFPRSHINATITVEQIRAERSEVIARVDGWNRQRVAGNGQNLFSNPLNRNTGDTHFQRLNGRNISQQQDVQRVAKQPAGESSEYQIDANTQ